MQIDCANNSMEQALNAPPPVVTWFKSCPRPRVKDITLITRARLTTRGKSTQRYTSLVA